jgi:DNA polymerase III delta prime subunit
MAPRTKSTGSAILAPAEPLSEFKQYTMAHPKLKEMHEQILRAIREPGGVSLLFILGPTGVGKTTLVSRLMRQLTCDLQSELERDRERMAVAGIEAEAPALGNYDFKQHFKRSLKALGEILVDYRLDTDRHPLEARRQGLIIVHGTTTAAALRSSMEESLKRRRPAAFFIDEAHHLSKVTGMRKFQDHLDVIKSLANTTETLHVLVGTYELQVLLNLSDQLSRRSRTFHFERYRPGHPPDVKVFQNIIWNFQQRLPFSRQQDLRQHSEYLMERSLGCVGILKGWFVRAAGMALEEKAGTLALRHLNRHQLTDAEWRSIATALLEGEESLRDSGAEIESLRLRLQEEVKAGKASRDKRAAPDLQQTSKGQARPPHYPGERRPRRDPIGKK